MRSIPLVYHHVSMIRAWRFVERVPLFQGYPNCVMNWVNYRDRLLVALISLDVDVSVEDDKA
jgi:hypothetical protein